ncbi:MAG TPA: MOSC domain-containing protein [Alphaproteobacteria bacterium]|jgi:uncharacterized protein YcbX
MQIAGIHRYPVKSLAGEGLDAVALAPDRGLLNDRRYAFVPAQPGAPAPAPGWRPKSRCVALVRYTAPARLAARYDDASGMLALSAGGREIARGCPENPADRAKLEAAAATELAAEVGSGVALAAAGAGAMLTDVDAPYVSLVNLASVAALAAALGVKLDPLRFRANFYFAGAPAWAERSWAGREAALGGARLEFAEPIRRCAAIEVDPATATRGLPLLRELTDRFGHVEMGIYAEVRSGGTAARGDILEIG